MFSIKRIFNSFKKKKVNKKSLEQVNPHLAKQINDLGWDGLFAKGEPLDKISKHAKTVVLRIENMTSTP